MPPADRAWRSPRAWAVLLAVLLGGLAVDLASKAWAFSWVAGDAVELDRVSIIAAPHQDPVPPHRSYTLPGRLIDFRLVVNRGAVFGIARDQRAFFVLFTAGALLVGLILFGRHTRPRDRLVHAGLGLALAGGLGNLHDRITLGVVRDFVHLLPGRHLPFGWRWPGGSQEFFPWVFNAADIMLLCGMGLLVWALRGREAARPVTASPSPARPR